MSEQLYGYGPGEHEYSVTVPPMSATDTELIIYVSAHGGGTVGEEYAGNGWDYLVVSDGARMVEGSDIRSAEGRAAGHAEMARTLANFLSAAGESLYRSGDSSEYAAEYDEIERAFLVAEYERLADFAYSE